MENYKLKHHYFFVFLILLHATSFSAEPVSKTSVSRDIQIWDTGHFNGNRIYTDMENNGMFVSHRISGHSGMEWPYGMDIFVNFASGIWVSGLVNGEIRTAVAEYAPEYAPGPYGGDATDNGYKLYKVNLYDLENPSANADFQNWPVDDGAPWIDVDNDGVYTPMPNGPDHPKFLGDQVIWYVANDGDITTHVIFATDPLGIETQTTIWGYDRLDPLGDMMFVKQLIINKGIDTIENAYIGLWADPDIGNAGDDFVGCDTTLGMGFCYNDGADADFGVNVPAIGYDFFQGPIIPSMGDTAYAFGRSIPDYKNLGMSSFTKYINGDPDWSDPNNAMEAYNLMQGLKKDGTPVINSETGEITKFAYPDDPNLNTGPGDGIWVDGDDHASGDRRFLMNAGPFTMAPGDSQEVIFAIIIGQGASALESVTRLKEVDQYAQTIADNHYELPDDTTFYNFSMVGNIQILSDNLNNDGQVNNGELIRLGFDVTNIYIDSASFMIIPRILSAGVIGQDIQGIVIENLPQPPSPGYIYSLSEDEAPLIYVSPDFDQTEIAMRIDILDFASGMWNYHDVTVPVTILDYEPSDSVQWVDQIIGDSEGKVGYWVVNPNELNGHTYTVSFTLSYSEMTEELGISLFDETTGEWLLTKHALPDEYLFDFPAIDGFKLVLEDAPKGFKGIYQVANGNGPIQGGLEESITEDMLWINFLTSQETPTEQSDGGWFFTTHGGGTPNNIDSFNDRVLRGDNWNRVRGNIFEMRFTNDAAINGMGYRRFEDGLLVGNVPFEQWNIGPYADDTSDDYRMLPVILNGTIIGNANDDIDAFDFWGDDANSSANNDPSSDWVYWGNPDNTSPGTVGYDQWVSTGVGNSPLGGWMEVMARTRLMNWNGSASHIDSIELGSLSSPYPINWTSVDTAIFINNGWYLDPENDLGVVTVSGDYAYGRILHYPDIGTIYRWVSYRPVDTTDVFQFTTEDNVVNVNDETLPLIFSLSQNFPNPFNPITNIKYQIPKEEHVKLVIYDLLGREIRVLVNGIESPGQKSTIWDGKDQVGSFVSSGMYFYRMKAGTFEKTRKMVLLK